MNTEPLVLALDLGTGSVKAGLVTQSGEIVAQASQGYPVTSLHTGWSETDPRDWWAGVVAAVQAALQGLEPKRVQAISFSGQMHGVVLCSASGEPLRNAVLWSDTRSARQLEAYAALSPPLLARLGNPPVAGFAGPTLLWLQAHEPQNYRAARWALQPKDWLRLHCTGEAASEPSDASGTLLYDLTTNTWSAETLAALGLNAALLPPLRASGEVAGRLLPAPAAELGLPAGIPVVMGAADTAAALLGTGLGAGEAQLTVGTGAQIVVASPELPTTPAGGHVFRDAQEGFYALAALQNAGNVLEWVRATLRLTWPELYAAAQEVAGQQRGGKGTPLFLPYLTGDRTPHLDPHARAAWLGLEAAHDWRHMAYAAFEGVALSMAEAADALDLPAAPLKLAGGGSLNPWWRQLLADSLGRTLAVTQVAGASVLGAARLGWQGLGLAPVLAPVAVTEYVVPHPDRIPAARHAQFRAAYGASRMGEGLV